MDVALFLCRLKPAPPNITYRFQLSSPTGRPVNPNHQAPTLSPQQHSSIYACTKAMPSTLRHYKYLDVLIPLQQF